MKFGTETKVPCPKCFAEAGMLCTNKKGKPKAMGDFHTSRTAAARAYVNEKENAQFFLEESAIDITKSLTKLVDDRVQIALRKAGVIR